MPYKPDKPWERQSGESGQAYEAFATYRDMGKSRTVSAVVKRLGKSRSLLDRWKALWNWEERVAAYDNDLERKAKEEAVKDRKTMLNRHIKIAMQVQKKAIEALDKLNPDQMTAKDIKEYIRMATDLERLSRTLDVEQEAAEAKQEGTLADAIMASYQKRKDGDGDD
nr:MAG TPA: hypothetical protein [Caudoviricetes sp.]